MVKEIKHLKKLLSMEVFTIANFQSSLVAIAAVYLHYLQMSSSFSNSLIKVAIEAGCPKFKVLMLVLHNSWE